MTKLNVDPTTLIDWFDAFDDENPWAALSNFYVGEPFYVAAVPWPGAYTTGEHAFQAQKAISEADSDFVRQAYGPAVAKARGRNIVLRPDWEQSKIVVMRQVLLAKFAAGRVEAVVLLATGQAELVEGTWWNDRVWGVDLTRPDRPGRNELGKLLMARRTELTAEVLA